MACQYGPCRCHAGSRRRKAESSERFGPGRRRSDWRPRPGSTVRSVRSDGAAAPRSRLSDLRPQQAVTVPGASGGRPPRRRPYDLD
eukprot:761571-Hanusia_phi.AAC.1